MNRKPQLIEIMDLGPVWRVRAPELAEHPVASWLDNASAQPECLPPPPAPERSAEPPPTALAEPMAPGAAPFIADAPAEQPQEQTRPDWETLERTVSACRHCRLGETRTQAVFGRGNRSARWLIVGEAPGEQEDRIGEPFVGRAGKLLDNMLAAMGLTAQTDVFIANVLKCRPPGNRNPAGDEIAACQGYLHQQIALLQPEIILALGRFAAQTLLETEESISRLRGRAHTFQGRPLIVSYHPAYLLRNPSDKAKAWQDMVLAKHILA